MQKNILEGIDTSVSSQETILSSTESIITGTETMIGIIVKI